MVAGIPAICCYFWFIGHVLGQIHKLLSLAVVLPLFVKGHFVFIFRAAHVGRAKTTESLHFLVQILYLIELAPVLDPYLNAL